MSVAVLATVLSAWLCSGTLVCGLYAVAVLAHRAFVLWVGRTIETETAERVSKLEVASKEHDSRVRTLERERATPIRR